ncbi:hypothetical protein [Rhodococcus wratislaviensis]|uniref:Uncharacterized protein n=1 Tax=Rhodococcus wratislaviensis NBRC 100605 TaxID=1219028 RepID=X0Q2D5_RHOWR|nr:hypothetical protein [Rhodococcus wratislaviensis]GAF50263.1 hypothetical protein RW1_094_03040 [Rhodococcus wratislaviensis NBRC 100605]
MGTVLALVAKLPASLAQNRARLQMFVAWANVLLHRFEPMQAAVMPEWPSIPASFIAQTCPS